MKYKGALLWANTKAHGNALSSVFWEEKPFPICFW